jgi:hypothetical protein
MAGYAWLTPDVWRRTWRRAYLFALRLKHPPHEAEDFVGAAVLDALDPQEKPWAPLGEKDFASHVCNCLYSRHGNYVQSYDYQNARVPLTHEVLAGQVNTRTPEQIACETEDNELAGRRYDALLDRVEKDALVSLLLEDGEGESSTDRARAAGYSLDDIEAGRKRLKRYIEAVVKQFPAPAEIDERRAP